MKIILVTTSFPLFEDSMSGIFIRHLVDNFDSKVEVTVVTPDMNKAVDSKFQDGNYRLVCFRYAPKNWQLLAHQPGGIPTAIKQNRPLLLLLPFFLLSMFFTVLKLGKNADIIHANWSVNGLIACVAGFFTGTPVITTLRGSDVKRARKWFIDGLILKICLVASNKISVVSDALRTFLNQRFTQFKFKIVTIPNGVSKTFLNICPNFSRSLQSVFKFSVIGNLTPNKCVDVVINALKILSKSGSVKLDIIGNGPEYTPLIALASKLDVLHLICFRKRIIHSQIHTELQKTDALVLSSYSEGRPNVVVEAMAAGVPVIATDIEGVRELIEEGETGLLFEPGNFLQLANKMENLLNDHILRKKLSKNGRQFVIENDLTWEKTAKRFTATYQEMIRQHRTGD